MEPDETSAAVGDATIRFKHKKRKTVRQRADTDSYPTSVSQQSVPAPTAAARDTADDSEDDDDGLDDLLDTSAVQAALKLRQARSKNRFRRGGVAFGLPEEGSTTGGDADAEMGLVVRESEQQLAAAQGLPDRFMHQTGFVADANDRHMMAYVESRLSNRAGDSKITAEAGPNSIQQHHQSQNQQVNSRRQGIPGTVQTGQSTTSWTKLVEVKVPADLLNDSNQRQGGGRKRGAPPGQTGDATKQQPPARRRRNRRGSDDIKRDEMVEAFLHENKLDVYDVPATSSAVIAQDPSRSADDILAENFRQQYMDEMALRRQRRRPAINQPRVTQKQQLHQQAVAAGEVLKGPKLGGSRNSRAAVRDALLQQQEMAKRAK